MPIEKRWVVKPQGDSEAVAKLASVLRISPVLANLLVQRGLRNQCLCFVLIYQVRNTNDDFLVPLRATRSESVS